MAIVFPASPSNNDTFTVGSITYTYDGSKWIGLGVTPTDRLLEGSNSLEITAGNELVWTGGKVGVNQVTPIAIFHAKSGANDGSLVSTFEGATNNKLNIRFDTFGPVLDVTAGDPLAFEIGGNEQLRITSGGIGINEATPDSKLDIVHSTATNAATENLIHLRTDPAGSYASRGLFVKIGRDGAYDNSAVHYDIVGSSGNSGTHIFEVQGSEKLRIDSSGLITTGGKTASDHGSPNLLLWGADTTLHLTSTGSANNSSFTGIKFTVAGGSTGDYSKAGIFVQRQDSYNDLDMIFAFRATNDSAGVEISDEKLRIDSDGGLKFAGQSAAVRGTMTSESFSAYEEGTYTPAWVNCANCVYDGSTSASYTRIGRMVIVSGIIAFTTYTTFSNGWDQITLPFIGSDSPSGGTNGVGYWAVSGGGTGQGADTLNFGPLDGPAAVNSAAFTNIFRTGTNGMGNANLNTIFSSSSTLKQVRFNITYHTDAV